MVQCRVDSALVLGKVRENLGFHVVRNHRHPVIFLQGIRKCVRGIQGFNHEVVIRRRELNQQDGCDGSLGLIEGRNLLRRAVFHDLEVLFLEARDGLAVLGGDQHIQIHKRHVYLDRVVGHVLDLFRFFGGRRRWFFLFLGDHIRPDVVLWSSGCRGSLLLVRIRRGLLRRVLSLRRESRGNRPENN